MRNKAKASNIIVQDNRVILKSDSVYYFNFKQAENTEQLEKLSRNKSGEKQKVITRPKGEYFQPMLTNCSLLLLTRVIKPHFLHQKYRE